VTDRDNPGGGGLTGATGDLTPDAPDQAFEPAERREVAGPDRAQVTDRQGSAVLAPEDPAYGMEIHPAAGSEDRSEREARIGGDELTDSEERF
jgi:hypothetical protein